MEHIYVTDPTVTTYFVTIFTSYQCSSLNGRLNIYVVGENGSPKHLRQKMGVVR